VLRREEQYRQALADGAAFLKRFMTLPFDVPESAMCLKTTISYWMWSGEGQDTSYCQCMDSAAGNVLDITPPACLLP
ncbi:MAG TPA: hypothetical protein PLR07_01120, partial [Promineifilum sp.]|nr:hypothetical protein [Promineifilum sp.]